MGMNATQVFISNLLDTNHGAYFKMSLRLVKKMYYSDNYNHPVMLASGVGRKEAFLWYNTSRRAEPSSGAG